jgi:hypothetical protein
MPSGPPLLPGSAVRLTLHVLGVATIDRMCHDHGGTDGSLMARLGRNTRLGLSNLERLTMSAISFAAAAAILVRAFGALPQW